MSIVPETFQKKLNVDCFPKIVGIVGKKYSGKDTTADIIIKKYGYTKIRFGDAVKDVCKCIFNFTDEQLYGNLKEQKDEHWNVSPRHVLQFVGTDLFRNQIQNIIPEIKDNIWIEVVKKKIIDAQKINPNAKFVICDVRFENESNFIKELNGVLIKIHRPELNYETDNHQSETQIDNIVCDYNVTNDMDICKLKNKICDLFENQLNIN